MAQSNSINVSKLNTYVVVEVSAEQATKINAYAVIYKIPINGNLNKTLGSITGSFTGLTVNHGVLNQTLGSIGIASNGYVGYRIFGNLDVELDGVELSASGTVTNLGVLSATFEPVTLEASGAVRRPRGVASLFVGA